MIDFWPWWLGGAVLATVVVVHVAGSGRLLTVSGILARVVRWSQDEVDRRNERELATGGLDAKLLAATRAQFGDAPLEIETTDAQEGWTCESSPRVRLPISAGATFLVALGIGGLLSALLAGGPQLQAGLGPEFTRLVGTGATAFAAALGGGFLVGFGARMAGGCTSGHGLCGMGRLQAGSLVATCAFFAGGIAVSFLLEALA